MLSTRATLRRNENSILDMIEAAIGMPVPRKPVPKYGYQNRDTSYPVDVSNHIPSPQPFVMYYHGPHYNKLGAVVPFVPTRKRVPDNMIIKGTPCASPISNINNISPQHSVFYDVRTGEIALVVRNNSKADHFYTRYYEGKATFPYINKMRGDDMHAIVRADIPPIMLIVNDEPVYWGYGSALARKMRDNKAFAATVNDAKSSWLQLQQPFIRAPRTRPVFDVARLRFVQSLMSMIKP